MLSTLEEEGLSKSAKALLRLLKWAEQKKKESLQKEAQQENKIKELNHACYRKNSKNDCSTGRGTFLEPLEPSHNSSAGVSQERS
ncbi:hypothetical protein JCM12825_21640 [Desulfurobacterium crinifex]